MKGRSVRRAVLVPVALAVLLAPVGGRADHTMSACTSPNFDPLLCPQQVPRGESCIAHGILITERDLTGVGVIGDAVVDLSRSDAWIGTPMGEPHGQQGGGIPLPPQPPVVNVPPFAVQQQKSDIPPPPPDGTLAFAHGDAQQAGASYAGALASVSTSNVYSRCDVAERFVQLPTGALVKRGEAYGRGGVHDLELGLLGGLVTLESRLLDYEVYEESPPFSVAHDCELVRLGVSPPGLFLEICPGANTGVGIPPIVEVELNENWGPVPNAAGQLVSGGAMVHATVFLGVTRIDVYVGYAAVAVPGEMIPQ